MAEYLRTAQAAAYLSIGKSTLERRRLEGTGPAFRKAGSRTVLYDRRDLDAWVETGATRSAWTQAEEAFLRDAANSGRSNVEIASAMNRSVMSVSSKVRSLNRSPAPVAKRGVGRPRASESKPASYLDFYAELEA